MIRRPTIALALLLAPIAVAAEASVRDFRLPPPRPTTDPDLQGPVDPEAPVPVQPRPAPTPAPDTPEVPADTQGAQRSPPPVAPAIAPPSPRPTRGTPLPPPPRATASPLPRPRRITAPPPATPGPAATVPPVSSPAIEPPVSAATDPDPSAEASRTAPSGPQGNDPSWWWLLLLVPVLLAGAAFARRSRRRKPGPAAPVPIAPPPPPPPVARDPVEIVLQPIALTRSLRFVTLECSVTITNRSGVALEAVALEGRLSTAHAKAPLEDQIAGPGLPLDPLHRIDRLALGQREPWEGTLRLPLDQLRVIRQGSGAIFVPLVRLRVVIADGEPMAATHVVGVGRSGARGALQPFRADTPPRSWRELASRPVGAALDAPAPGR